MNKKYFIHFTWIVTLIMLIFTGLCLVDGVSIFVPFFTYITAMILYVLPMSFIGSKEAELVCIELENESGKIKQIEQIITQKMKREIIIDNVTEKKYCKKNKYDRWLTNDIIVCDSLSCPNSALIFVRQLLISLPQLRLHFRGFLPRIYFTQ